MGIRSSKRISVSKTLEEYGGTPVPKELIFAYLPTTKFPLTTSTNIISSQQATNVPIGQKIIVALQANFRMENAAGTDGLQKLYFQLNTTGLIGQNNSTTQIYDVSEKIDALGGNSVEDILYAEFPCTATSNTISVSLNWYNTTHTSYNSCYLYSSQTFIRAFTI